MRAERNRDRNANSATDCVVIRAVETNVLVRNVTNAELYALQRATAVREVIGRIAYKTHVLVVYVRLTVQNVLSHALSGRKIVATGASRTVVGVWCVRGAVCDICGGAHTVEEIVALSAERAHVLAVYVGGAVGNVLRDATVVRRDQNVRRSAVQTCVCVRLVRSAVCDVVRVTSAVLEVEIRLACQTHILTADVNLTVRNVLDDAEVAGGGENVWRCAALANVGVRLISCAVCDCDRGTDTVTQIVARSAVLTNILSLNVNRAVWHELEQTRVVGRDQQVT